MSYITNPQKYREATCSKNEEGFLEEKPKWSRVDPQNASFQEAGQNNHPGLPLALLGLTLTRHFGSRVFNYPQASDSLSEAEFHYRVCIQEGCLTRRF